MFRSPEACRIHHLLDAAELHKDAELFPGIGGEFARVDDYLVSAVRAEPRNGRGIVLRCPHPFENCRQIRGRARGR